MYLTSATQTAAASSSTVKQAKALMQLVRASVEIRQRSGHGTEAMQALPPSEPRLQSLAGLLHQAARRCTGCPSKMRILDVGGGSGIMGNYAKGNGWAYTTIDLATPQEQGSGFNHERGLHNESLTYDGQHLPFSAASYDVVIMSFMLHHAAENTLGLLKQVQSIATNFVLIGEDLASQEHPVAWHERNFQHQPDGVFRSDTEWRQLFELVGLKVDSAFAVLWRKEIECALSDEEYDSKVYRALYMLRSKV